MSDKKKSTKKRNPDHQALGTDCVRRKIKRSFRRNGSEFARALAMHHAQLTWYENNCRYWRSLVAA